MKERIAIIGTGISGLAAAWLLRDHYDVTVYEQNDYIGGHSNTQTAQFGDVTVQADTGFMVCNKETYPHVIELFKHLDVPLVPTTMSLGVQNESTGFEFVSNRPAGTWRNWVDPKFWYMLYQIVNFNKNAPDRVKDKDYSYTVKDLLADMGMSDYFVTNYFLPFTGAVWSTEQNQMLDYPAVSIVNFMTNHGLLTPNTFNPIGFTSKKLQWYTVKNGSIDYVQKISKTLGDRIKLSTKVTSITRNNDRVQITDSTGATLAYNKVICASHSDQTLTMLSDADDAEQEILSVCQYTKSSAVMHKDPRVMLQTATAWPSWTSRSTPTGTELSYYMNELQHIDKDYPVFVTINPQITIDKEDIFYQIDYSHPLFTTDSFQAQDKLQAIQGQKNTYFIGAWTGYGFHEDGLRSAVLCANSLRVKAPWQTDEDLEPKSNKAD